MDICITCTSFLASRARPPDFLSPPAAQNTPAVGVMNVEMGSPPVATAARSTPAYPPVRIMMYRKGNHALLSGRPHRFHPPQERDHRSFVSMFVWLFKCRVLCTVPKLG